MTADEPSRGVGTHQSAAAVVRTWFDNGRLAGSDEPVETDLGVRDRRSGLVDHLALDPWRGFERGAGSVVGFEGVEDGAGSRLGAGRVRGSGRHEPQVLTGKSGDRVPVAFDSQKPA